MSPGGPAEDNSNDTSGQLKPAFQSFQNIILAHTSLADKDNVDNEPVRDAVDIGGPHKISELFDFSQEYWFRLHDRTAQTNLRYELELYEPLNCDEDGVGSVNVDSTAEALLNQAMYQQLLCNHDSVKSLGHDRSLTDQ